MTDRSLGFAQHAREQRERWLALTPEERLRWLEGAKRFERAAREGRERDAEPAVPETPSERTRR